MGVILTPADWAAGVGSQVQGEAAKYGLSFSNYFTFRDYLNASFGLRAKYVFFRAQQAHTGKRGVEHTQSLPVGRVWT